MDTNDLRADIYDESTRIGIEAAFGQEEAEYLMIKRSRLYFDEIIRQSALGKEGARCLLRNLATAYPLLGTAMFEVGDILEKRGKTMGKALNKGRGVIYFHIDHSRYPHPDQGTFIFCICALELKNTYNALINIKPSPFYEISRRD